jgi:crotonobetainyl-CoA:carnitine CoA-transferase CaiB-like acyl-CoA transferase
MKVLNQIRVIDTSPYLPSQYCSFQLEQLGAEVILTERPGERAEPFPGLFELLNCNKKSIQLDLKSDTGREIFHRLAETSDVIIEGFRPGVMGRLGIGYEDIKKVKPDIIYCSISGFGQDGPYKDKPGHDVTYLGLSGFFSVSGQIGTRPSRPGIPIVDLYTGMMATISILASIMMREKTGEGQYIDLSMFDVVSALTSLRAGALLVKNKPLENEHIFATNGVFMTKDGLMVTLGIVNEEHFWQNLCKTVGDEFQLDNPLFSTHAGRVQNSEKLNELLTNMFLQKTRAEWLSLFKNTDVPLSPVATIEEALSDPQILHRGLINQTEDTQSNKINVFGFPVKFSRITTGIQSPPPKAGQHTRQILEELGYADEIISTLEPREAK